jgi:hypothetical protein
LNIVSPMNQLLKNIIYLEEISSKSVVLAITIFNLKYINNRSNIVTIIILLLILTIIIIVTVINLRYRK